MPDEPKPEPAPGVIPNIDPFRGYEPVAPKPADAPPEESEEHSVSGARHDEWAV